MAMFGIYVRFLGGTVSYFPLVLQITCEARCFFWYPFINPQPKTTTAGKGFLGLSTPNPQAIYLSTTRASELEVGKSRTNLDFPEIFGDFSY